MFSDNIREDTRRRTESLDFGGKFQTVHGQHEHVRNQQMNPTLVLKGAHGRLLLLQQVVSRLGLEPRALALKGRCSTD